MKIRLNHVVVMSFCLVLFLNWNNRENTFCQYLSNAEIQFEGKIQKENIKQALQDMLGLSIKQLKKKRYKDYQGKPKQWDLKTLIYKHFVPDKKYNKLGRHFFRNIKSDCAQKIINKLLSKLN